MLAKQLTLDDADNNQGENRAYWSPGGQIFFCEGRGYGVARTGQAIIIGKESVILKALKENTSLGNNIADNILRMERNNR